MKNNLPFCFIDFDGTINDCRIRLYQFFINNASADHHPLLSLEEYWNLKRMGINEVRWINEKMDKSINEEEWSKKKIHEIESLSYLKYDRLFPFSNNALLRLKNKYRIVLVTKRMSEENLIRQINDYGILSYFDDILCISGKETEKQDVVRNKYELSSSCIFVGDTEEDIRAGLELKCSTFFTLSGIRGMWITRLFEGEQIHIIDSIDYLR